MTEADVRKKMMEGFDKIKPKVADMTTLLMDVYQEGFNNCWEILTGQSFLSKNNQLLTIKQLKYYEETFIIRVSYPSCKL